MSIETDHFPFPVQLHLKCYIDRWRSEYCMRFKNVCGESIRFVEQTLNEQPFLFEPITDLSLLHNSQEILDILFALVLPHNGLTNALQFVASPFNIRPPFLTATEAYRKLVHDNTGHFEMVDRSISKEHLDYRTLYAYKVILKKFYSLDLKVDQPGVISYIHRESGLTRYFKLTGSTQFFDVINLAPLPALDERMLQKLLDRNFDPAVWKEILPPEIFLFSGLSLITLVDITIEESVARLQHNLLDHPDITEPGCFYKLQQEMRNLFRLPDLKLGVHTFKEGATFNSSRYIDALKKGETIIVEDIQKQNIEDDFHLQSILCSGYRNVLLAPLMYDGSLIGILELTSPTPGEINGLGLFKINQIKPIFVNALKRHMEVFENRVEAILLKNFTSIHPAIQWRFRNAAINLLDDKKGGNKEEDIFFENIYPFYGSLDIRDSSIDRNRAIAKDLLFNLESARTILQQGYEELSFEILGELVNDIDQKLEKIKTSFSSGDEVSTIEFIRKDIHPVMLHLRTQYPHLFSAYEYYQEILNSDTGICASNRLAYEEAVAGVNRCIIGCLDEEEASLQQYFPCYFEKYRTDGVEYNIYTGSAIAPDRQFDPLYLDNLQLRQLIWTCRIMCKIREFQQASDPNHAIEIAPLILAYGNSITLKFRADEKRLDVHGSYDIRYEMLKKRLDKALILGTKERLTQPGYIAIVYTRDQEVTAYMRHINYLVKKEYVTAECENLTLAPLQSVEGLRAIRIQLKN